MLEFQQFQEKIRKELKQKLKFSKDLIELRDKEAKLVKMKKYDDAEKVKMKADLLEEFERNKLDSEVNNKSLIYLDANSDREEGGKTETLIIIGSSSSSQEDSERQK